MKKFLALVLALVMTMSLVTISAGAEDFTDAADVTYEEAVDVMTAVGVVGGYADGSFNPTAGLTRGAAAKIICNMILGPTTAEALVANEAPYSDVAVDNVFAGYIAYCANEGIISGYADGTFKPAAPLTGYAFMKMLLGALGYDAVNEGYVGSNWSIAVAKRALNVGLDDGLVTDFSGAKALTREEACLYAFNALNAQMVEYENDSKITVGDIVISNSSKAEGKTTGTPAVPVLFRDEYFTKLDKVSTSVFDDFGRPAHTWYTSKTKQNDDTKIGTYADAADYTVVVGDEMFASAVEIYNEYVDKKYAGGYGDQAINGRDWAAGDKVQASPVKWYGVGDVVEFFLNDTTGAIAYTLTQRYDIAEITEVSTKLTKAQKEDGATCKIELDDAGSYITDDKIVGFDAETYVEGAYILFITNAAGTEIIASEIAESVEGTITATKGNKVAVDGVYYVDTTGASIGDEGIFYLGKGEQIMDSESTAAKSDNYAFIYNVTAKDGTDADGQATTTVTVYYVTVDGTKASAVAKVESKTAAGVTTYYLDDGSADTTTVGSALCSVTGTPAVVTPVKDVVAFSINSDGKFVEETAEDVIVASGANNIAVNKTSPAVDNSAVANDETTFVFVYTEDGSYKTKVSTGYKNVNIASASGTYLWTVYDNATDKNALYTFVDGVANGKVTTDANLAVLLSTSYVVTENADEDVIYTYDVAIDGVETTLSFNRTDGDYIASAYAGMVFAYELNGEYAEIDTTVTSNGNFTSGVASKSDVVTKGAGYFTVGSPAVYWSTSDATVYTITVEFDNTTSETNYKSAPTTTTGYTIESIEVSEGATFAAEDWVYFTQADTNEAEVVFVVKFIA